MTTGQNQLSVTTRRGKPIAFPLLLLLVMGLFLPACRQEARVTKDSNHGGAYTLEDSRLSFQWKGAGSTTATIEGNTFTMDNEGVLYAYRK